MNTLDHAGRFAMLRGHMLELPRGRTLDLASGGGTLWVTFDNDPRDFVLEAGERLRVPRGARALVNALDDAVLELRELAAA